MQDVDARLLPRHRVLELRARLISRPHLLDLPLHEPIDLGNRRIRRFLNPSLRSPPRDLNLLACLLADRPDGDLGFLTQPLDVSGDLGTLLPTNRRHADAYRGRVQGVGVEAGLGERLDDGRDVLLVERRDQDAVALLLDDPETPDRDGVSVAVRPLKPMLMVPVRMPASCSARRLTVFCIRCFQSIMSEATYEHSELGSKMAYLRQ
jgi:hypothetical protein